MDSFFGIGAPELIAILLLAGIVMGPQRIRQVALWLGKTTAQLQSISRGFVRQLNAELDAVDGGGELRDTMAELQDLRQQVKELRREITSGVMAPVKEGQTALRETQAAVQQTIAPPSLRPKKDEMLAEDALAQAAEAVSPSGLPNLIEVADDPE